MRARISILTAVEGEKVVQENVQNADNREGHQ